MSILKEIFEAKKADLQRVMEQVPESILRDAVSAAPASHDFLSAISRQDLPAPRLIAEVKYKSPSKGVFRPDFDPLSLARSYAINGAAAISVITEEQYFGGHLNIMKDIQTLDLGLPLLRKDFIFDPYQLLEARANGASAVLLIVAMLKQDNLVKLIEMTGALGMSALIEVHDEHEMQRAIDAGAEIIGINNRNLHDFSVSLDTTLSLAQKRPPGVLLVSESGINKQDEIIQLAAAGIDAVLIGETLIRSSDLDRTIQAFSRIGVP